MTDRDQLCINTLRFLSIDMVEKARSGHPGAPMGMAAMAYALWQLHLMHNPNQPRWINRDRFVLSAGHASALLYSLLHVYGYPIMIEDLTRFRQLGSITPGHPECNPDLGIETTTGPLGQGLANGVGMAIAERWLAGRYNRPGLEIIDHLTYVIASDGDMMEGVTSEAASMAGTLKLGKLVVLYDDNRVTIEGSTSITFCEDVGARFEAYGWQVIGPLDGMDFNSVDAALKAARENINQPSLIICRTEIGYGSPGKAGTAAAHGEPLGQSEAELTRRSLGWEYPLFTVPEAARSRFAEASQRNLLRYQQWQQLYQEYSRRYGQEFQQLQAGLQSKWLPDWDNSLDCLLDDMQKPMATREASGMVLNAIGDKLISLIGGSADLAPSTKTVLKGKGEFSSRQHSGRNLHFGVREHAMGAIANGISLHGGVLPYIATFLIFYDYMRPPVRLAP
jgi:transketolase